MASIIKNKSNKTPKDIAIIMDGNGRWAIANSLNVSKGHKQGVQVVRAMVEESVNQNIDSLTLYAFSTENWSRPKPEIKAIKQLVLKAIEDQVPELIQQKVKLKFFGHTDDFGEKILKKIKEAENATLSEKPSLQLNVALGYGGRQDIVDLTKEISSRVQQGKIKIEDINEDLINKYSCSPVSEVDLLIRTGGDRRISNFLLYQVAYSEISFIDKYWPDFTKEDFIECIENFKKVSRRFGKRV
ncbi:MAG: undecaprenyl diphosphate synthase [Gammaproteobacteria bacterium]|jgi:undecaprenyl diphosphate synthase|tara:strand:- start:8 stop:736 length:729 start_codon:yes stop_codon:yes gene_type:complete